MTERDQLALAARQQAWLSEVERASFRHRVPVVFQQPGRLWAFPGELLSRVVAAAGAHAPGPIRFSRTVQLARGGVGNRVVDSSALANRSIQ